jgi:hypothetical protein
MLFGDSNFSKEFALELGLHLIEKARWVSNFSVFDGEQ